LRVYFFQCQEAYGNSVYLPYSSGILWNYINQFDAIKANYELVDIFFEKIPVQHYVDKLDNPDYLLFSNYGWNTTYHLDIAKRAKEKFPNVKIIIGGPNAQQSEAYLNKNPYVDISVWGEGEQTLLELFTALITTVDLKTIPGISFIQDNVYYKTDTRQRRTDLTQVPSPYLTGMFDSFFQRYDYNFMPVWETNRGCPYHCTFCDLGADYYNKLFEFDTDRLLAEIKWFSDKKIEYVEVADANFGILPRDMELVKYIKKLNTETGYPQKINATWAKNSPERVFEMSTILESMNRGGVTLALQSQNKTALSNIKRINIANDRLETITKRYIDMGIQTYHDFILGLPGETVDSWKEGLLHVVNINPEGWIFGHPLEAYENTEFSDPDYIAKHNIKFAWTPQVSYFALRNKDIPIEMGKYVISHTTLTSEQYKESFLFKWFLISMHSLGWAKHTASSLGSELNIKIGDVYSALYDWMLNNNSVIHREYNTTHSVLSDTIHNGNFWGRQVFGEEDIYWEYEGATSIIYEQNRTEFYNDLKRFVTETYGSQYTHIVNTNDMEVISFDRHYPYKVDDCIVEAENYTDFVEFCQSIYWKGRRIRKWRTKVTYES
jgi:radical SAM superfamily enzyme YgiQ (UPF0313 family)